MRCVLLIPSIFYIISCFFFDFTINSVELLLYILALLLSELNSQSGLYAVQYDNNYNNFDTVWKLLPSFLVSVAIAIEVVFDTINDNKT